MQASKPLGEHLIERGYITESQLEIALQEQRRTESLLGETLERLGFVSERELTEALSDHLQVESVDLSLAIVDPVAVAKVPRDLARKHRFLPLQLEDGVLTVAMADASDVIAYDQLVRRLDVDSIDVKTAPESEILKAIEKHYELSEAISEELEESITRASGPLDEDATGIDDAPIVALVNQVFSRAILEDASDIHFEPEENLVRIRCRVDGVLHQTSVVPSELEAAICSRIKIMAGLDITERRLPQDGRIQLKVGPKEFYMRVSTLPTVHGENIVIRLLDKSQAHLGIEGLGLSRVARETIEEAVEASFGLVLLTGPTGSGKTTTLYSVIKRLNSVERSIATLEDPVEYELPMVRQTQINPRIGLTFAHGLRAILRQDPNIVLVGEIRDLDTVEIAIRAAMTGHLVLSTLHTNTALEAIPRLTDLGVDPFLFTSSLRLIGAQRLVRRICEGCREEYEPGAHELERLGLDETEAAGVVLQRGTGCEACKGTGYRGRIGIFEMILPDDELVQAILDRASTPELQRIVEASGTDFMWDDGRRKVLSGVTTLEEVLRVL